LLLDDEALGLEHLGPVHLAARTDAPLLGPVDVVHDRRRLEERLRRDAAAKQARPAELLVAFDDGDPLAELRGAERRRVPARARAEREDVVGAPVRHPLGPFVGTVRLGVRGAGHTTAGGQRAMSEGTGHALRRTPLDARHRALGAKMGAFAGWDMPIEYAGTLTEHRAVREAVGLFDLTHLGKILLSGPAA